MNRYLKYTLWMLTGVIALITAVIAYIALTFDPNSYKPQIIQAVKDNQQRILAVDGDIQLHFFPNISLGLGRVTLSEYRSDREFAALQSAVVSLKLLPLLSGRFVIDEVAVSGLKAHLVKYKDGSTSFDDLSGKAAPSEVQPQPAQETGTAPMEFDIAAISIENSTLTWLDEKTGAEYSVQEMNIQTGRIANGLPTTINLALRMTANKPKADITAKLKTGLTFDLGRQQYRLQGMQLQASGEAMGYTGIAINAGGDAGLQLSTQEYSASNLSIDASANKEKERYGVKLRFPELTLNKENVTGREFALAANMQGAYGDLAADMSLPIVEGNFEAFKANSLAIDINLKQPSRTFAAKLAAQLVGSLDAQRFNFSNLRLAVNATGDELPGKHIESELKGSIQADLRRQYIETSLAGGLLQSQIKARASVRNFKVPMIRYDLEVDRFDADPYLPKKTASGKGSGAEKEAEQPFDLSALKPLNVEGSLKVGSLKAANVKLAQLRMDVKGKNGIVDIAPLSARLYKGKFEGKAKIDANTSAFAVNEKLSGVDVAPLLKDAADLDIVEGRGNIALDLAARGNTVSALKKALNGKARVELANGAIKGIDLAKLVRGLQNLNKDTTTQTLGVDKNEKTLFTEFKASFNIRNGVARNNDLAVKSTVLRLAGKGNIDIGNDRMDYDAKAIFAKTAQGKTGTLPVKASGPFDDIKFKVDYAALLKDVAKQKLDEKKEKLREEAKAKAREELKRGLKNLFK